MNLLQAILPEYLADLAAAATLTAITWITRKARWRKTKTAPDHIPPP
ncbi:hypothetical protein H1V43_33680 [Streptomyces sp. PSKA54]|uniref:Uncharacterized protein n=1 Tax=Streptomyces himalayensis subsp. aureolus TaxID=2758039 RepID=A0A7W2HJJ4_9ACTN|nr:hypothetical protein [Streptomyces himalayensis]MBA4866190.1 hypothetical protein [Streptomyces himalayensis subsp. aureolus]